MLIVFISIKQCGIFSFLTHYKVHISVDIRHDSFPLRADMFSHRFIHFLSKWISLSTDIFFNLYTMNLLCTFTFLDWKGRKKMLWSWICGHLLKRAASITIFMLSMQPCPHKIRFLYLFASSDVTLTYELFHLLKLFISFSSHSVIVCYFCLLPWTLSLWLTSDGGNVSWNLQWS